MKTPEVKTIKNLTDKFAHLVIVTVCEVVMAALAVQGMLSIVHTQHNLQIAISGGLVGALLVIRYRVK